MMPKKPVTPFTRYSTPASLAVFLVEFMCLLSSYLSLLSWLRAKYGISVEAAMEKPSTQLFVLYQDTPLDGAEKGPVGRGL
jgi:hypothetical protein